MSAQQLLNYTAALKPKLLKFLGLAVGTNSAAISKNMDARRSEKGFTLVEVLIVTAILSVLAAIAIPQFTSYRAAAYDRTAQSNLRAVAIAEEAYFVEADSYVDCTQADCHNLLPGVTAASSGSLLAIVSTATGFTGTAQHAQGSGKVFTW